MKKTLSVFTVILGLIAANQAVAVEFEASRAQKVVEQVLTIKSDEIPCEVVSNDNRFRKTSDGYSVELSCAMNYYELAREKMQLKGSSQLFTKVVTTDDMALGVYVYESSHGHEYIRFELGANGNADRIKRKLQNGDYEFQVLYQGTEL